MIIFLAHQWTYCSMSTSVLYLGDKTGHRTTFVHLANIVQDVVGLLHHKGTLSWPVQSLPHEIPTNPLFQPAEILLNSRPVLQCIYHPSQFGTMHSVAEGALSPTIHLVRLNTISSNIDS